MNYCELNECGFPEESGMCAECPDNYGLFEDDGKTRVPDTDGTEIECDYRK